LYVYKYYKESFSRMVVPELYTNNIYNAIEALYERLHVLDNYEDVREAVEAHIYRLYSWGINCCIIYECNSRIVSANKRIEELVKIKNRTTSTELEKNKYIKDVLEEKEILVIKKIAELY